jgi:hypothetical protein
LCMDFLRFWVSTQDENIASRTVTSTARIG